MSESLRVLETEPRVDAKRERAGQAIAYLLSFATDPKFRGELVAESARSHREALDKEIKARDARAAELIAIYKKRADAESVDAALALARERYGDDPNIDLKDAASAAKTLRKAWGEIQREVAQSWKTNYEGSEMSLEEISQAIRERVVDGWAKKIDELASSIPRAENKAIQDLDALVAESEQQKDSPDFMAAIDVWGNSPDSHDQRGEGGKGVHAGIAHFFEYRRDKSKSGRFSTGHEMTFPAFIKFSEELRAFLENPDPTKNPDVADTLMVEDELDQRRLMILTKQGMFMSAFQEQGQPMRVITGNQKYDTKRWQKDKSDEFDPEKTRGRLNQLGQQRIQISLT